MKKIFIIFNLTIALFSCSNPQATENEAGQENAQDILVLTEEQAKNAHIETSTATLQTVHETITATGKLDVPPQNLIDVSAPMGGFVKNTSLLQGMEVKKGEVLLELQHADYIQLQQDYLTSKSQQEFLEKEYIRQQELAKENINAQKTLQQSKAQAEAMQANVQGIEAKLALINISPKSLIEKGIQQSIKLYSPINGYVTEINMNIGKYVTPSDVMVRLVNTEHIHAELQIFEKDITKIKAGQRIRFTLANESKERLANVYLIGREISEERTVRVHGHLVKEDKDLLPGMFINATIEITTDSLYVLPSEAIVQLNAKANVFIETAPNQFKLQVVEILGKQNETTALVMTDTLKNARIVTKGSYTLLSLMTNTEE